MIGVMALSELLGLQERRALARQAQGRRSQWPDRAAAWAGLHGRGIFRGWSDAALHAYVEHALQAVGDGVELKCRPSREAEIFASYPRRLWRSLAAVSTPTLVVHGGDSYPFVGKGVARWCALNHHVSAQRIAGGHCFMQEQPDECAGRVRDYLLGG
ncbi:Alpha/beta hydrolase family protein [compost metagenome]